MKYFVTLVHGTFASGAPWIDEESILCRALRKLLDAPVEFRRVRWSGRNTAAAREAGALRVTSELRDQLATASSQDKHFIMAHSHGGNVAMYAMRDAAINAKITGIVTMATPFTIVSRRLSVYWDGLILGSGFGVYALMFSEVIYETLLLDNVSSWLGRTVQALSFVFLWGLSQCLLSALESHSDSVEERLTLPTIEPSKLLILRTAGDEASLILAFSQFLAMIPYRVFVRGLAICDVFTHLEKLNRLVGQVGKLLSSILIGIFIGPILILLWILQILFSMDPRSNNPFLDITSEGTPVGNWHVHMFQRDREDIPHAQTILLRADSLQRDQADPAKDLFSPSALLHSNLYLNWHALEAIARWMTSRK